jgi:uncharacterized membrane protein
MTWSSSAGCARDRADGGLADAGAGHGGVVPVSGGGQPVAGPWAGIRWRGILAAVRDGGGGGGVITVATWVALGEGFIFFGILHAIAAASLLGLLVLRVPVVGLVALAVLAFAAPSFARAEVFDPWWFWWTGLQTVRCARSITCRWRRGSGRSCWGWPGAAGTWMGLWSRLAAWRGGRWAERIWLGGAAVALDLPGASAGADRAIWAVTQVLR